MEMMWLVWGKVTWHGYIDRISMESLTCEIVMPLIHQALYRWAQECVSQMTQSSMSHVKVILYQKGMVNEEFTHGVDLLVGAQLSFLICIYCISLGLYQRNRNNASCDLREWNKRLITSATEYERKSVFVLIVYLGFKSFFQTINKCVII